MSVEVLDGSFEVNGNPEDGMFNMEAPLNGTDSRRRLEDKIEELRLMKEMREFDFDD
ncbi:hypothetical protein TDB9533_02074 [Thalassocella blandensis]|nr:hypothetical protein TDB9533_02074 [Thalassocella blandensis]